MRVKFCSPLVYPSLIHSDLSAYQVEMKAKMSSRGGDSRLAVKKTKAEKDPNKPKHPPSAFFIFISGAKHVCIRGLSTSSIGVATSISYLHGDAMNIVSDIRCSSLPSPPRMLLMARQYNKVSSYDYFQMQVAGV